MMANKVKAASQQQAKEAANSQGSNANNKLPLQSRTKESTSLNKSDQKVNQKLLERQK